MRIGDAAAAVLAIVTWGACESPVAPSEGAPHDRLTECEVTGAAIREFFAPAPGEPRTVVLLRSADRSAFPVLTDDSASTPLAQLLASDPTWRRLLRDSLQVSEGTIQDFIGLSATEDSVCTSNLPSYVHVARERPRISSLQSGTVVIQLSRPAVGAAGDEALFTLEMNCGALCGNGDLIAMRRDERGRWRVVGRINLWVS